MINSQMIQDGLKQLRLELNNQDKWAVIARIGNQIEGSKKLRAYFIGESVEVSDGESNKTLSLLLEDLIINFDRSLKAQNNELISEILKNTEIKKYLKGNSVSINGENIKISVKDSINYFHEALKNNHVILIHLLWNNNPNLKNNLSKASDQELLIKNILESRTTLNNVINMISYCSQSARKIVLDKMKKEPLPSDLLAAESKKLSMQILENSLKAPEKEPVTNKRKINHESTAVIENKKLKSLSASSHQGFNNTVHDEEPPKFLYNLSNSQSMDSDTLSLKEFT